MRIKRVEIFAPNPQELCAFYSLKLGLGLAEDEEFAVRCGDSKLVFVQGEYDGVYHFAFNIPADEVALAAKWLKERAVDLLPFEGNEIVPFVSWEAEAIYFHDPAGNIVELIGRKRMAYPSNGAFSKDSFRSISEMGFATNHIKMHIDQIRAVLDIPFFGNPSPHFAALGDDSGLFIVVDSKVKKWIPCMENAPPLPFKAIIEVKEKLWEVEFQSETLFISPVE